MNLREALQWWAMQDEKFRQDVLKGIPGCIAYGLVKSQLPKAGTDAVLEAYRKHAESYPQSA